MSRRQDQQRYRGHSQPRSPHIPNPDYKQQRNHKPDPYIHNDHHGYPINERGRSRNHQDVVRNQQESGRTQQQDFGRSRQGYSRNQQEFGRTPHDYSRNHQDLARNHQEFGRNGQDYRGYPRQSDPRNVRSGYRPTDSYDTFHKSPQRVKRTPSRLVRDEPQITSQMGAKRAYENLNGAKDPQSWLMYLNGQDGLDDPRNLNAGPRNFHDPRNLNGRGPLDLSDPRNLNGGGPRDLNDPRNQNPGQWDLDERSKYLNESLPQFRKNGYIEYRGRQPATDLADRPQGRPMRYENRPGYTQDFQNSHLHGPYREDLRTAQFGPDFGGPVLEQDGYMGQQNRPMEGRPMQGPAYFDDGRPAMSPRVMQGQFMEPMSPRVMQGQFMEPMSPRVMQGQFMEPMSPGVMQGQIMEPVQYVDEFGIPVEIGNQGMPMLPPQQGIPPQYMGHPEGPRYY